jgi:hypothetical protein
MTARPRRFQRHANAEIAAPALLCLESLHSRADHRPRILVGFDVGDASDLMARLITQWLGEQFGHQFAQESASEIESSLALTVLCDKLRSTFSHRAALFAIIAVPRSKQKGDRAQPFLAYPSSHPLNLHSDDDHLIRLSFHGSALACLNRRSGRAQVILERLPGAMEFGSAIRSRRPECAARSRVASDMRAEATAWYGLGVASSTPGKIVKKIREQLSADPRVLFCTSS